MAGKGFSKVYNLSGGIKAWEKVTAVGSEDLGMELFTGRESVEETIITAFGLEEGLREFYLTMQEQVLDSGAKDLFAKLADIEILHQERLVALYKEMTGQDTSLDRFLLDTVTPALEGGMTTKEYLQMYQPNMESIIDILSLAMSIEAQALDLYQRAADSSANAMAKAALQQIANEERGHLKRLAVYMDQRVQEAI